MLAFKYFAGLIFAKRGGICKNKYISQKFILKDFIPQQLIQKKINQTILPELDMLYEASVLLLMVYIVYSYGKLCTAKEELLIVMVFQMAVTL